MLQVLDIKNLTVFAEASLRFSPQLNVFIGENGTGKSHILKVVYSVLTVSADVKRKPAIAPISKTSLQGKIAEKLVTVLRPESLGRLTRRKQGRERCELSFVFDDHNADIAFSFSNTSKSEVSMEKMPTEFIEHTPVFVPTRELLTIFPNFVSVYEGHYLELEETWRDTCLLLGALPIRGPRENRIKELLIPLEAMLGGKVEQDTNGRFYLSIPGQGRMEMHLVAEGLRKIAMLARLIVTGSLIDRGCLFWDEPEANLNPKLIKGIARAILHLCRNGIQVFIATHSLFLIRELDILTRGSEFKDIRSQYFGLQSCEDGVSVPQGESVDDIGAIDALDEELNQSDRYLEAEEERYVNDN